MRLLARSSVPVVCLVAIGALTATACTAISSRATVTRLLDTAIAGAHRTDAERARDRFRHPRETLLYFGLRPNQTVVEIMPIGGWYTKIIAPVVRRNGQYVAALPPAAGNEFSAMLAASPEQLDQVQVVNFDIGKGGLVPDGTADLVLTFRNIHNWMAREQAEAAFRDMFRALKPGGTLGVVEHRGDESVPQDPRARSGYVNESHAIRMIESAGFRLVAKSQINANPRDTRDHPGGVWNLPPVLSAGETGRERYLAIGESDRFTLKFVKPR